MDGLSGKDEKVVVNVIGAGRWGPNIIRNFYASPDSTVNVVCDIKEASLARIKARFPSLTATSDHEDAIRDPDADAVAIITPASTHFELAEKAIAAGKDVLLEKPMATSIEECEKLIELAQKRDRIIMLGHTFKYNPSIKKVKEIIESGEIGRVISLHAVRTNLGPVRSDVNALWDLGSHDLSIFNLWLNSFPNGVTASGLNYLSPSVKDTVMATFIYPGGIVASIHASWLHPRKVREITVVGEEKMIVWDDLDLFAPIKIFDRGFDKEEKYIDTFGAHNLNIRNGNITIPPVEGREPLADECKHFIECVKTRRTPISDAAEGLEIVKALTAADESLRGNSIVVAF